MKKFAPLVALTLLIASCNQSVPSEQSNVGVSETASSDPSDAAIAGKGGIKGWFEFVKSSSAEEINNYLKDFNIKYINKNVSDLTALAATGCPVRFGATEYNTMQTVGRTQVWIDGVGRPYRASQEIVPIVPTPRTTTVKDCSAAIGKLGGGLYRGGHLVGIQLGGYGLRANLVPQIENFNSGNWAQIENAAVKCQNLYNINVLGRRGTAYYETKVIYLSNATNVPYEFQLKITTWKPGLTSDDIGQTGGNFLNETYGGTNGTAQRIRIVQDLQSEGCL